MKTRPSLIRRRGVMTIVALVCVMVASTLMIVVVRRALTESQLGRLEVRQAQSRWLAESGLERAAARLASDPKYSGEVWKILPGVITGRADETKAGAGGTVRIEVTTPPDQPSQRVVRVQADWPDDPALRARQTKQATIERPPGPKPK
jgi:type II secretory pathway component PulK